MPKNIIKILLIFYIINIFANTFYNSFAFTFKDIDWSAIDNVQDRYVNVKLVGVFTDNYKIELYKLENSSVPYQNGNNEHEHNFRFSYCTGCEPTSKFKIMLKYDNGLELSSGTYSLSKQSCKLIICPLFMKINKTLPIYLIFVALFICFYLLYRILKKYQSLTVTKK